LRANAGGRTRAPAALPADAGLVRAAHGQYRSGVRALGGRGGRLRRSLALRRSHAASAGAAVTPAVGAPCQGPDRRLAHGPEPPRRPRLAPFFACPTPGKAAHNAPVMRDAKSEALFQKAE